MEIALSVISCILILSVIISLIHKKYWVYAVLEYPRLQKLAIIVPISVIWLFLHTFQ